MKKLLSIALTALITFSLAASTNSLKVLMIGNSFSISNCKNMPQIAKSLGLDLELGSLHIGGCSLQRHWANVQNPTNMPYGYQLYKDGKHDKTAPNHRNIPDALKSRQWDVVTIQQASHESWKPGSYHPYGDNLVKAIRELAPQAKIVLQETWSYSPWDKRLAAWKIDQNEMYDKLHDAYYGFAKEYFFEVIPMGTAVQEWRRRLPVQYTENSFGGDVVGSATFTQDENGKYKPQGDVFHLNSAGQYFQSLVWTAKLFHADVTKCTYVPVKVSAEKATLMKQIAMDLAEK